MKKLIFCAFILVLAIPAARSGQQLDGVWVGTEKLTLSTQTGCANPVKQSMPAKIAIAQNGSLLGVVDGYAPGRYPNLRWAGSVLIFELPNRRKGELHLSADGKTLIEKGYVHRTIEFGAYSGAMGNALIDHSRHGALNNVQGSQPSQVTVFTPCVDELTGIFHREK